MKKSSLPLFLFAILLFACNSPTENTPTSAESETTGQTAPGIEENAIDGLLKTPGSSAMAENEKVIKEVFKNALPNLSSLKAIQFQKEGDCEYSLELGYSEKPKARYSVDLKKLDINKMNVFFDDNDVPGIRLVSKEGENAIQQSVGRGSSTAAEEMTFQLDDRKNVAKVVFALRDMIKQCQKE
jgi:hypothetical protein